MSDSHALGDEPRFGRGGIPMLYNLVYCSRAVAGIDEAAVASARRHNPEHGITGMLVFGSGIFFQWLEGPRDDVTRLMDRLRSDPRHDNVVVLSDNEEVRERLFPAWDMELVGTDDIRDVLLDAQSTNRTPGTRRCWPDCSLNSRPAH